jgi:rifampicin phosphotransferase
MRRYVLDFREIDESQAALAGGKGAHLGELSRIDGIDVPAGFCVTTEAFRRVMSIIPGIGSRLGQLSRVDADDREAIGALSGQIRRDLEEATMPDDLAAAITGSLAGLGEQAACAVRSSATAEDLPGASFAGQHDTYLNVVGPAAILRHISRCWASLFTDRAVAYRLRNGFGQQDVQLAVVVQQMVFPQAAGVLFTADPVTGNRAITTVEATFGLGEALVGGLVNADVYQVRDDAVVSKVIATKRLAVQAAPQGGTREQAIEPGRQQQPALTDAQAVRLAQVGRQIEAHFGRPQDIEWCLAGGQFQIVQSRPITTLFPIPVTGDHENHVYVSVGHQQMMTDPIKPLGLSVWQLTTPRPMAEAGGRLFVDVTPILAKPASRAGILRTLGRSDPLIGAALQTVLDRGDFVPAADGQDQGDWRYDNPPVLIEADPGIVAGLIEAGQASLATLKRDIGATCGPDLLDFIVADIQELRRVVFGPRSLEIIMAGMGASWWLNEHVQTWLGEKNVADVLTQSAPGNVTAEMGLALLDVADVIRPYPGVVAFLEQVQDDDFLTELPKLAGGQEARDAIQAYLDKYGMRCVGEIDITRPRWSERPAMLVPMILSDVRNFAPGAAERRFEQGSREAGEKEQDLLTRVRALPDGEPKAAELKAAIARLRTFIGYREYPKYHMICRYFVYKQALLTEARRLADAGVLRVADDIFFLRFTELGDVMRTQHADGQLIRARRDAFASYQALTPPRVLLSDGEMLTGTYQRDGIPAGALAGLPVSAGTVEGRARVVRDMAEANFQAGDILVTAFTDPSWTPAFPLVSALVTEVGGLMTHGAVIAREYGLPAVVGVEHATRLIADGQRIRVHGADGYVELLPEGS